MANINIEAFEILAQAAASPFGIALSVSDFEAARQRLYGTKAADTDFADLSFRKAPDGALWIVKNSIFKEVEQKRKEELAAQKASQILDI